MRDVASVPFRKIQVPRHVALVGSSKCSSLHPALQSPAPMSAGDAEKIERVKGVLAKIDKKIISRTEKIDRLTSELAQAKSDLELFQAKKIEFEASLEKLSKKEKTSTDSPPASKKGGSVEAQLAKPMPKPPRPEKKDSIGSEPEKEVNEEIEEVVDDEDEAEELEEELPLPTPKKASSSGGGKRREKKKKSSFFERLKETAIGKKEERKKKDMGEELEIKVVEGTFRQVAHVGLDTQLEDLEAIYKLIVQEAGVDSKTTSKTEQWNFKKYLSPNDSDKEKPLPKSVESALIDKVSGRNPKSKTLDISACQLTFFPDMLVQKFRNIESVSH